MCKHKRKRRQRERQSDKTTTFRKIEEERRIELQVSTPRRKELVIEVSEGIEKQKHSKRQNTIMRLGERA